MLYFLCTSMIICIFFMIRNQIVYKITMRWNNIIYNYRTSLLDYDYNLYKNLPSYESCFKILPSYDKMLLMVHKWTLNQFLNHKDIDSLLNPKGE